MLRALDRFFNWKIEIPHCGWRIERSFVISAVFVGITGHPLTGSAAAAIAPASDSGRVVVCLRALEIVLLLEKSKSSVLIGESREVCDIISSLLYWNTTYTTRYLTGFRFWSLSLVGKIEIQPFGRWIERSL